MGLEATLLDLEAALWRAAGDREGYAEHLAPDAPHVFPGLGLVDRDAVLDAVDEAEPWKEFNIDSPRVISLGDEVVALLYRARARRAGEAPYQALITSVHRRGHGRWRLVLHQQTQLDE